MTTIESNKGTKVTFLELEITRKCQLACSHCYADSGPTQGHGTMTTDDWRSVLRQAADLGVQCVQFIGGEPTQHPAFAELLEYALSLDLQVRVYSNLVAVRDDLWKRLRLPGVSLATPYYSDDPEQHGQITGTRASHARIRSNIARALQMGIPVSVGIIEVLESQRVGAARQQLQEMGVKHIEVDQQRGVGRAATGAPSVNELCGRCGLGTAAIGTNGDVWPCVLARFLTPAGNVRTTPLGDILASKTMADLVRGIPKRGGGNPCRPDLDGSDCRPADRPACLPDC